jgi:hypothetical protein
VGVGRLSGAAVKEPPSTRIQNKKLLIVVEM